MALRLGGRLEGGWQSGDDVPRQEFLDPVNGMVRDAGQHHTEISFRVETVQFRRTDQTIDDGSSLSAGIGRQFIMPEF